MSESKKMNGEELEKVAGGSTGMMPNPNVELSIPKSSNKCILCGKELDHEWPIKDIRKPNSYCTKCLNALRRIQEGND